MGGSISLAPVELRGAEFDWRRPYVIGVVNVTPDSFSDGGLSATTEAAVARAGALIAAGADWLDVGGESTRPGAEPVDADREAARVVPVLEALRDQPVPISIDTTKASVAEAALDAGADVVNDISGGLFDPDILRLTQGRGAAYVCGHVRGRDLRAVHAGQGAPPSVDEVGRELAARLEALPPGLRARTVVDPCLGFGKGTAENLALTAAAGALAARLGRPILLGPSRKRFLGELTGRPVDDRDTATVGACLAAVAAGAHLLRVHDVAALVPALAVFEAVARAGRAEAA